MTKQKTLVLTGTIRVNADGEGFQLNLMDAHLDAFLSFADLFQNYLFQKFLSGTLSECQTV